MSNKAIRDIYGETLAAEGAYNQNVVVLDADVSVSTKSCLFGKRFPERFFNVGIAESAMGSIAAGMGASGLKVFANAFAAFISTIGLCPIKGMIAYDNLDVKIVGTYGGVSNSFDGASHHANEDLAIMRSIPNMTVLVFSDAIQTRELIKTMVHEHIGPAYLRSAKQSPPEIYTETDTFPIGKGRIVREGNDITIIACGLMVHEAVKAAEMVKTKMIDVRVVDMYSIKPIDSELILHSALHTRGIITVEEHNIIGGLGGAVAEVLMANQECVPFTMIGINDVFTQSGSYEDLLSKFGLNSQHIADQIIKLADRCS